MQREKEEEALRVKKALEKELLRVKNEVKEKENEKKVKNNSEGLYFFISFHLIYIEEYPLIFFPILLFSLFLFLYS